VGLADQAAQGFGGAKAAKALGGERHQSGL